jgi:membrane-bound lytic murein transglycosylase D
MGARSDAEGRLTHTVRRGETLGSIAARYGVRTEDIRRWNRMSAQTRLRRGTRLKIRVAEADTPTASATAPTPGDPSTADAVVAGASGAVAVRDASPVRAAKHKVVVVRRGETLSVIARRNGTTVSVLMKTNRLRSSRVIVGQRLRVPATG